MSTNLYLKLRTDRPDWTAIEAARVAVAHPGISPRGARGQSVPFADEREAEATALVETLGANPIVRETPLRAYPGWRVRQYADGIYDATNDRGLSMGCESWGELMEHLRRDFFPRSCSHPLASTQAQAGGRIVCGDCGAILKGEA